MAGIPAGFEAEAPSLELLEVLIAKGPLNLLVYQVLSADEIIGPAHSRTPFYSVCVPLQFR